MHGRVRWKNSRKADSTLLQMLLDEPCLELWRVSNDLSQEFPEGNHFMQKKPKNSRMLSSTPRRRQIASLSRVLNDSRKEQGYPGTLVN